MFYYIIIIIIIIIYILYNNIYINHNIDNIKNKETLIIFLIIKDNIKKLIEYCLKNETNKEYLTYIQNINNKIDIISMYENNMNNNNTSYTINKGEKMIICIRSKNDYKIHDINEIMYVIIHEISHIGCPEIGHTHLFLKINKYFLEQSIKCGIYKYDNYSKKPIEYCGIKIDNNLIDSKL